MELIIYILSVLTIVFISWILGSFFTSHENWRHSRSLCRQLVIGLCLFHMGSLLMLIFGINFNIIAIIWQLIFISILSFKLGQNFFTKFSILQYSSSRRLEEVSLNSAISQTWGMYREIAAFSIIILISSIPVVANISNSVLYTVNLGPDFEGHLWSSMSLFTHDGFYSLFGVFKELTASYNPWTLHDAWSASTFQDAVGIEFLLRTLRSYHAVIPAVCQSLILQFVPIDPIYIVFPLLALQTISIAITGLIVSNAVYRLTRNAIYSTIFGLFLPFSNITVIAQYEGITGQLLSLPFYSYAIVSLYQYCFNCNAFSNSSLPTSELHYYSTRLPLTEFCLVVATAITAQGEGLQLSLLLVALFIILRTSLNMLGARYHAINCGPPINNLLCSSSLDKIMSLAIAIPISIQFICWSGFRLKQGFSGGALHLQWDPLAVSIGMSHSSSILSRATLLPSISHNSTFILAFIALLISGIALRASKTIVVNSLLTLASIVLVFTLVSLTRNSYAAFKVGYQLSPILLIAIAGLLQSGAIISFVIITTLATFFFLNIQANVGIIGSYQLSADKVSLLSYENICPLCSPGSNHIFIFDRDSANYLRKVVSNRRFILANSAWGPKLPQGKGNNILYRVKSNVQGHKSPTNKYELNSYFHVEKLRCSPETLISKDRRFAAEKVLITYEKGCL